MNGKITARILGASMGVLLGAFAGSGCSRQPAKVVSQPGPDVTFKPQEMADALHAIIAAGQEIYFQQAVKYFPADARRRNEFLAAHAGTLRAAAESIQRQGAEFHYVLRSLWPVNPKNSPETETEKRGLQFVSDHRGENFYAGESLGGRRYFVAVYGMAATSETCADCHNQNTAGRRKDFKTGDIMGGLIVRVPLEF